MSPHALGVPSIPGTYYPVDTGFNDNVAPVDPHPVVDLLFLEGEHLNTAQERDVPFQYNANLFLYDTLEHARVMAQGRLQTTGSNPAPVIIFGVYLSLPRPAVNFFRLCGFDNVSREYIPVSLG